MSSETKTDFLTPSETTKVEIGQIEWHDDKAHFESLAAAARQAAIPLLEEMYGERCKVFDAACECCKRWKLLDDLLENPFDETI